mgnify:CR=1 FL=1|jgi:hypothetical protein
MQDRYVADVGDFGKYGLLRCLAGMTCGNEKPLRLGVIWYLTPSCLGNANDGKHLSYLDHPQQFKDCDKDLFCKLQTIREEITLPNDHNVRRNECMRMKKNFNVDKPALERIHNSKILGEESLFFDAPLHADTDRANWWEKAREKLKGKCDLLFLDPDNGLRVRYENNNAELLGRDRSGQKHISKEEICEVLKWGASAVVIYHHLGRHGGDHDNQIRLISGSLKKVAPKGTAIRALRYRRGSSRVFFVLIRKQNEIIQSRIDCFKRSFWVENKHFQVV